MRAHLDRHRATAWRLAAGALASALVALLLPAGDAFTGTLVVLPFIVAALVSIEHEAAARGARRLGRHALRSGPDRFDPSAGPPAPVLEPVLELAALLLLTAAALLRHHLGLTAADPVLAAAFATLLGQRVVRQVIALRPLLGSRLPPRPSALFFFLPLVAYLALVPWQSHQRPPDGDEPYYLLITHSLAYDLDADLTNNYADGDWRHFLDRPLEPQPGDPVGSRGQLYSRHNETLPLVLAPAYRLAGKWGALAMMALLAAALAWVTLRLCRRYWPEQPGEALVAWALLAFTPPLLLYSYQVWVEVPAALLSMLALDRILSFRGRPHWGWKPWLAVGLPILLLPLLKIRFMLLAVPLVMLAWWYAGRPRKPLILLSIALAAVGGGILVHNQLLFDNPLKIHQVEELELNRYPVLAYLAGATGLFWDSAFGLFATAPLWMLLLPAALAALARRGRPLFDLVVFGLPYLAIVVPRNEWYGGWSPPFRYALVVLPLLTVLLVPLLSQRRRPGARLLVAGLGIATAALTLVWIVEPGWTYNFADGRTYLLDHLSARLGADVARFFPSSVRPRLATWLWPPLTLLVVPLVWWWPWRRTAASAADTAGEPANTSPRHRPSVAGATAGATVVLLLALAVLPWAAERVPTHRLEMEDAHVTHSAGNPFPRRWVIERTRHRGGWVLPEGSRAEAPVVAGGDRARLHLTVRLIPNVPDRPVELRILAGSRLLATWTSRDDRRWAKVHLGPVDWPAGEPLVVEVGGQRQPPVNALIVDRADFEWQ